MIEMPPVGDETLRRIMDRRALEDPGHVLLKFQDRDHTFGEIRISAGDGPFAGSAQSDAT